jgi:hypothetical protein
MFFDQPGGRENLGVDYPRQNHQPNRSAAPGQLANLQHRLKLRSGEHNRRNDDEDWSGHSILAPRNRFKLSGGFSRKNSIPGYPVWTPISAASHAPRRNNPAGLNGFDLANRMQTE